MKLRLEIVSLKPSLIIPTHDNQEFPLLDLVRHFHVVNLCGVKFKITIYKVWGHSCNFYIAISTSGILNLIKFNSSIYHGQTVDRNLNTRTVEIILIGKRCTPQRNAYYISDIVRKINSGSSLMIHRFGL